MKLKTFTSSNGDGLDVRMLLDEGEMCFVEYSTTAPTILIQPWIQFPPKGFCETQSKLVQQMVDAWNDKYSKEEKSK